MQRTFHLIEITSLRTLDGNNQSLLWENRCNLSECAISTIGSWIWTDPELIAISYMPEICRWLEGKFRGGHLLQSYAINISNISEHYNNISEHFDGISTSHEYCN